MDEQIRQAQEEKNRNEKLYQKLKTRIYEIIEIDKEFSKNNNIIIGSHNHLLNIVFGECINEFCLKYPNINLDLKCLETTKMLEMLKNKELDIVFSKKVEEFENQNIYEHMVGKVSWMHIELEDFGVNIIEFIDSHEEGSYKEINRLIKSVNQGEIQAVLVWDFNEIPLELRISLVEECSKRNVYIDGFLTSLEIKDNN